MDEKEHADVMERVPPKRRCCWFGCEHLRVSRFYCAYHHHLLPHYCEGYFVIAEYSADEYAPRFGFIDDYTDWQIHDFEFVRHPQPK